MNGWMKYHFENALSSVSCLIIFLVFLFLTLAVIWWHIHNKNAGFCANTRRRKADQVNNFIVQLFIIYELAITARTFELVYTLLSVDSWVSLVQIVLRLY
jgi:hypothetical protein